MCFLLFVAAAIADPSSEAATCTTTTNGVRSSNPIVINIAILGPAKINPDDPIGTVLFTQSAPVTMVGDGTYSCSNPRSPAIDSPHQYEGTTGSQAAYNTYKTAISGVGIRFKWGGVLNNSYFPSPPRQLRISGKFLPASTPLTVELVKIGPITAGGAISGEVARGFFPEFAFQTISYRTTGELIVTPQVPTCKVTTPSVVVNLGNRIPMKIFTGVGATSPAQSFNIDLLCSGGSTSTPTTNVYTTLTDQTNPGNFSNILSLTSNSTAKGLGIQVSSGTTVIQYGADSSAAGNRNQWRAGSASNGTFTISLTGRYIQIAPMVTPGSANGRATFTMSYQ